MHAISERILLTIWVGGMWVVGYLVAPTLFAMIDDRAVAGSIAGRLFMIMSYVGIFAAIVLLVSAYMQYTQQFFRTWRVWVLVLMLALIVSGEFVLQPQMAQLRADGLQDSEKAQFGMLHGIASVLFLINSLCGLALVIFGVTKKD
jgi:hypothetical protein